MILLVKLSCIDVHSSADDAVAEKIAPSSWPIGHLSANPPILGMDLVAIPPILGVDLVAIPPILGVDLVFDRAGEATLVGHSLAIVIEIAHSIADVASALSFGALHFPMP
jgi:hypothetical protein